MTEHALEWERTSGWADSITRMFERNLTAALPALVTAETLDSARGRRIAVRLVETLGGYAYGLVAAQVARAVLTWFGAEQAARVRAAARRAARTAIADEPEELIPALRIRFGLLGERLAEVVDATLRALPAAPGQNAALANQLQIDLDRDDRLALEIATGWQYAAAVIERAPLPALGSPRARELWRIWSRLAGHREAAAASDRDLILRIG